VKTSAREAGIRKTNLRTVLAGLLGVVWMFSSIAWGAEPAANDPKISERCSALQAWFQRLSEKRPSPEAKPEEVEAYNKECGEHKSAIGEYAKEVASLKSAAQETPAPQDQVTKDRAEIEAMKKRSDERRGSSSNEAFVEPPYGKAGTLGVHVLKVKGKILKTAECADMLELAPDSGAAFALAPGWEIVPLLGSLASPMHMKEVLIIIGSSSYTEGDIFEDVVYPICSVSYTNRLGQGVMVYNYATSPRLAQQVRASDPSKNRGRSTGSGFFISDNGHLVTNWHVIKRAKHLQVRTQGQSYEGTLLVADKANDLAVIKIDAHSAPLPIVSSRGVLLGDDVFTIGFPDSEMQGVKPKLTSGSISSLSGIRDDPKCFQISVPIQPGNSGGGLIDSKGNVVGIVCATLNPVVAAARQNGGTPQNVNYAIKSSLLLALLENIPEIAKELPAPRTSQPVSRVEVFQAVEAAAVMVIAE
jgi:S1-C subfamily serine protease